MQLKSGQINKFKDLHKDFDGFEHFSDDQIAELANCVANYYLTLFQIHQRIKIEGKKLVITSD